MRLKNTLVWGLLAVLGCRAPEGGGKDLPPPSGPGAEAYVDLSTTFWLSELALANGQELDVSVTVKNRGTAVSGAVAGRWELVGPGLDANFADSIPELKPRETAKISFTYPFSKTQAGEFVLRFTADPHGKLDDSNLDDNTTTLSISVAQPDIPPRFADLQVALDPTPLAFDIHAYVVTNATITNHGPEAVPVVGVWEFQGPNVYASIAVTAPVLNAGESTELLLQHLPEPTSRGWHTLTFTALPGGEFVEADTSNNSATVDVLILPYPNASVEILAASPLQATAASLVSLDVRWANTGLSPLLFSEEVSQAARVYLVRDGEAREWANYLGSVTVPVLGPGEATTVTYKMQALRGPGSYSWHVTAATSLFEVAQNDDFAELGGVEISSPLQLLWTSSILAPSIALPATAEVNGDGVWDLVVGGLRENSEDNDLFAVDGKTGLPLWSSMVVGNPLVLQGAGSAAALAFSPDEQMLSAYDSVNGDWLWEYAAGPTFVSFVATDFDQNATTDFLIAGNEGLILLKVTDGTVQASWPFPGPINSFASSPALTDFNNDALTDVLVASLEGKVYAFTNTGGSELEFAWEVTFDAPVVGGPVIHDLDSDGEPEIAMSDLSGKLAVFKATGDFQWSVTAPVSRVWMSPSVVRHATGLALLISGSIPPVNEAIGWSSRLLAYDSVSGELRWELERPGTAGPAVSIDVDQDGRDEIMWLVGDRSPTVFPLNLSAMNDSKGQLYLVSGEGAILTVFEIEGTVWAPPLAGDLDLDGFLDIVVSGAGPDGAVMRLSTPWAWPAGSGWVGTGGASLNSGYVTWP